MQPRLMSPGLMRSGLLLGAVVLLADQASKYWVLNILDLPALGSIALLPVLNLTMVWNHGVTFGLFNGSGRIGAILLTLVAIAVVALLIGWMRRTDRLPVAAALGAITGGAVGNVIDRIWHGYVVDFLQVHWKTVYYFPAFNVADSAISIGAALLILDELLRVRRGR